MIRASQLRHQDQSRPWIGAIAAVSVSIVVISLAVLADAMLPGTTGLPLKYFLPIHHFGPFVASLIGRVLAFRLMKNWSRAAAVALFIVSALSILPDKLLLVTFRRKNEGLGSCARIARAG
jgi:hypothetical protein